MATTKLLVTFKQLRDEMGIPWSRAHLQRLEDQGAFPKRIPFGKSRVVWSVPEIEKHIAERMAGRDRARGRKPEPC